MWLDCGTVFINLDHVDYVCFDEIEQTYKATVWFTSGDSLNFEHNDIKILKGYFKRIFENDKIGKVG